MKSSKPSIFFIVTVEYAVNAFLLSHLKTLSEYFNISVLVNSNDPLFLKRIGVNVNVIPLKIKRQISFMDDFFCLIQLIIMLWKFKPTAVHSITPKAGFLGMLAAVLVLTPLRIHTFTGQVWVNKVGISRFFLKLFDCITAKLTTFSFIDSPSQRDFLIKERVVHPKKAIVFGSGSVCGVDLIKFKSNELIRNGMRSKLSIPSNAIVYIYIGRLSKDKGVLDLALAFSKIQDRRAYLIIVGPDEDKLKHQIQVLVGDNNYKLRMIGFSKESNLYLAASDILCLPSYREGFGSVIIEAAAMGLPAIASNIYGITDAIQNYKTGILHPPKNIDAIIRCMKVFLDNPCILTTYSLSAQERASKEFDAKQMSQYWLDFYLTYSKNNLN